MENKNVISVFEHERLTINDGRSFKKRHLEALITFNDNNKNKYFTVIRDGVKFSQYVGVIQAGNLTIEVLPKADKDSSVVQSSKPTWRKVLLDMLSECKFIKIDHFDKAQLNLRENSILEIYIKLFLAEVNKLVQNGLVKKYKLNEGNKTALKGRLDFGKNLSCNLIHKERFYVHFSEYDRDNIYNRLLLKTLNLIAKINLAPSITCEISRLLLDFPQLPDCIVSAHTFEKLVVDRKTESYEEALLISKMLLLNYRPDISGGTDHVISLLFDMNKLWEEFIFRRLKREEYAFGISVNRQQKAYFWKQEFSKESKTVRPDILVNYGQKQIIVDTKWKILDGFTPLDDDLQQMFIYNLFWKCDKSFLLYPSNVTESRSGDYHDYNDNSKFLKQCGVMKFMIIENDKLKSSIGSDIIRAILEIQETVVND